MLLFRFVRSDSFLGYSSTATSINSKWDLFTAVCLERKPIITPPPNELEAKFLKLLTDIEFERSLMSDHELQHELDLCVVNTFLMFS